MKTILVSQFKAHCLGLLRDIRDTGEPLAVTLRGQTLAVIQSPGCTAPDRKETIAETLHRLRPLLLAEEEEFEPTARSSRPAAPISEED